MKKIWLLDDCLASPIGDYERNRILEEENCIKFIEPKYVEFDLDNNIQYKRESIEIPDIAIVRFMTGSNYHFYL